MDVVDDNDPELPRGVEACWVPDTVTLTIRLSVYKAACRGERGRSEKAKRPSANLTVSREKTSEQAPDVSRDLLGEALEFYGCWPAISRSVVTD